MEPNPHRCEGPTVQHYICATVLTHCFQKMWAAHRLLSFLFSFSLASIHKIHTVSFSHHKTQSIYGASDQILRIWPPICSLQHIQNSPPKPNNSMAFLNVQKIHHFHQWSIYSHPKKISTWGSCMVGFSSVVGLAFRCAKASERYIKRELLGIPFLFFVLKK